MSRELDAKVAEQVMGCVACGGWGPAFHPLAGMMKGKCAHANCFPVELGPPHYSTDIAYAFLVVEAMRQRGYSPHMQWQRIEQQWRVQFFMGGRGEELTDVLDESLPLAISHGALAALAFAAHQPI